MSRFSAVVALATAMSAAASLTAPLSFAADMPTAMPSPVEATKARMMSEHLIQCYGVNAIAKNDCAAGSHSCAGQSTMARDPNSFVLLPAGGCAKLDGGTVKPS